MTLAQRLARPLLAGVFVVGGIDALRHPGPRVKKAEAVVPGIAEAVGLPSDPDQMAQLTRRLVTVNSAVQVGAGALLALGRLPRLAAGVLALSLLPTTVAGHRFWDEREPAAVAQERSHFLKNAGLVGGLLLAAVDTGGSPSLAWRAKRAAKMAGRTARRSAQHVLPGD